MTAHDIINLIAIKHSRDLFVPECKGGSTWFTSDGEGSRLDAWAMKRSWAHPLVTGYEVKVSRQDFISDSKWPGYLEYCNAFYFVCPPDVIRPDEVGNDAGLYWVSKNAKMLQLKKKAPYRNIEINPDVYRYILMCRTKIVPGRVNMDTPALDEAAYWRAWLKEKIEKRDLGRTVSKALRDTLRHKVQEVEAENRSLRRENEGLRDIKEFCADLGITSFTSFRIRNLIREALTGMPTDFVANLDRCIERMTDLKERLNRHLSEEDETLQEVQRV